MEFAADDYSDAAMKSRREPCQKLVRRKQWPAWVACWSLAVAAIVPVVAGAAAPDTIAERVRPCTTCHGREGRATNDGYFPRIAGKPAGYLYNQLLSFRDGRRDYAPMVYLVQYLSDDYLREMAEYFAGLDVPYPPPPPASASPATLARGEALVFDGDAARNLPACVRCHGSGLTGVNPAIPGVLGLPREYLLAQLGAWRSGHLRSLAPDCMADVASRLSEDDVVAVSAWLASRPVPRNANPAPVLTAPLPLRCGSVPGAASP